MATLVKFKKDDGAHCYVNAELVTVLYGNGEDTIICTASAEQSRIVVKGDVHSVAVRLASYKD